MISLIVLSFTFMFVGLDCCIIHGSKSVAELFVQAEMAYNLTLTSTIPGNCIPVVDCRPWLKVTTKRAPNYLKLLRQVNCAVDGKKSSYCCPSSNPPRSSSREEEIVFPDDLNVDVQHPNLKFLPAPDEGTCGAAQVQRIAGGQNAQFGEHPWIARLAYETKSNTSRQNETKEYDFRCAGVLISARYVLTAAHCVQTASLKLSSIRLGEYDISTNPDCITDRNGHRLCADPVIDVEPEEVIVHHDYNKPTYQNDIALVRLPASITLTDWIRPVCLPFGQITRRSRDSLRAVVAGWGMDAQGTRPQILQQIQLPRFDMSQCQHVYYSSSKINISASLQFCLGGERGRDSCRGDSGGPVLTEDQSAGKFYAIGLVSLGTARCGRELPSVYTWIPSYMSWILDNVR